MRFELSWRVQRDAYLWLPWAAVDRERLLRELTVALPADEDEPPKPPLQLYKLRSGYGGVGVPRNYATPLTWYGKELITKHGKRLRLPRGGTALGVRSKIRPRDQVQREAVEALCDGRRDKILCLSCGKGKTVLSLHAAVQCGLLPVLVVVPKRLLGQWVTRISEAWGIPRKKIGRAQQTEFRWKGLPIVVASVHTLARRAEVYPEEFWSSFRVAIFDECHYLATPSLHVVCSLLSCERWGLTATLKRPDGMDWVLHLHLGKVCYENLEQPLKPVVYFVWTGVHYKGNWAGFRRQARLWTWMGANKGRNQLISSVVEKCYSNGRQLLILGERRKNLKHLHEVCTADSKGLILHETKQREKILKRQVVFATQHLAKDGLDKQTLDTLLVLCVFGSEGRFRQSCGRILRELYDGGTKKQPKVFIFVDNIEAIVKMAVKLEQYAQELGFKTKRIGKWDVKIDRGSGRAFRRVRRDRVYGRAA